MLLIRINGTDNFENRLKMGVEGFAYRSYDDGTQSNVDTYDYYEDAIQVYDAMKIAKYLEGIGVHAIDISVSTYTNAYYQLEPGILEERYREWYQKPIKDILNIPVLGVNNVKRPSTAESLLKDGVCDFVGVGRSNIADPFWVQKALEEKDTARCCIGCMQCLQNIYGNGLTCSMNPFCGREVNYNEETLNKNGDGRNFVIIGAGPGGVQASIIAAKRGFKVTVFEKESVPGGALVLAGKGKGKDKITWSFGGMVNEAKELGVEFKFGTEITSADQIKALDPYAVVIAIGGNAVKPPIPGLDGENVYLAHDVLKHDIRIENKKVAVVGSGLTGLETTEALLNKGNEVVVYEMLPEIAKGSNHAVKSFTVDYLATNGVDFKVNHKLVKVTNSSVIFEDLATGETVEKENDIVVLSMGVKPNKSVENLLKDQFEKMAVIGDCSDDGGTIWKATRDALFKVWNL